MGSLEISKELEVDEDGFQTVSKKNKKAFKEPKGQQAAKEIKTDDRKENSSISKLTKPAASDSANAETLDDDMDLEAWMNSNKKEPEVDEEKRLENAIAGPLSLQYFPKITLFI